MNVIDAMARIIADAGCGVYDPNNPLPKGRTPITVAGLPAGGTAIAVATYAGGPEPDTRNLTEYPRLQVRVRSANPLAALALERTTFDALQFTHGGNGPRELAGGWWLQDCYALQSEAEPLGRDGNGLWEYVRNYQLTVQPPTAPNPERTLQ